MNLINVDETAATMDVKNKSWTAAVLLNYFWDIL